MIVALTSIRWKKVTEKKEFQNLINIINARLIATQHTNYEKKKLSDLMMKILEKHLTVVQAELIQSRKNQIKSIRNQPEK